MNAHLMHVPLGLCISVYAEFFATLSFNSPVSPAGSSTEPALASRTCCPELGKLWKRRGRRKCEGSHSDSPQSVELARNKRKDQNITKHKTGNPSFHLKDPLFSPPLPLKCPSPKGEGAPSSSQTNLCLLQRTTQCLGIINDPDTKHRDNFCV